MNETGIVSTYYRQLQLPDNRDKTIKAFLQYILERKPASKEYAMLNKVVTDFDYDIVFEALLSTRYSDVDFAGNYWGYVIAVCKNLLKESVSKINENDLAERTEKMLQEYKKK
jgi:hypothetical protein